MDLGFPVADQKTVYASTSLTFLGILTPSRDPLPPNGKTPGPSGITAGMESEEGGHQTGVVVTLGLFVPCLLGGSSGWDVCVSLD